MFGRKKRLRFECLESKRLLAGTVTAALTNGLLVINGDAADNAVIVSVAVDATTGISSYTIKGDATTVISGSASVPIANVTQGIAIHMKGGNDSVTIGDPAGPTVTIPKNLGIDLGDGDNQAVLNNISIVGAVPPVTGTTPNAAVMDAAHLMIKGGKGKDLVTINQLAVDGAINILTGGGEDTISIQNLNGGTGPNATTLPIKHLLLSTGDGPDHVNIQSSTIKVLTMDLGVGNDDVTLGSTNHIDQALLNGGKGTDTLKNDATIAKLHAIGFEVPATTPGHSASAPGQSASHRV